MARRSSAAASRRCTRRARRSSALRVPLRISHDRAAERPARRLARVLRRAAAAAARAPGARRGLAVGARRGSGRVASASGSRSWRARPSRPRGCTATSGAATCWPTPTGHGWLIDPLAYAGHREVDLAMLRLFGAPSPRILGAYAEAHPLADGHEERVELWQLFPLLVHAVLFGGGYGSQVEARRAPLRGLRRSPDGPRDRRQGGDRHGREQRHRARHRAPARRRADEAAAGWPRRGARCERPPSSVRTVGRARWRRSPTDVTAPGAGERDRRRLPRPRFGSRGRAREQRRHEPPARRSTSSPTRTGTSSGSCT